jgi:hypothetical protein
MLKPIQIDLLASLAVQTLQKGGIVIIDLKSLWDSDRDQNPVNNT